MTPPHTETFTDAEMEIVTNALRGYRETLLYESSRRVGNCKYDEGAALAKCAEAVQTLFERLGATSSNPLVRRIAALRQKSRKEEAS